MGKSVKELEGEIESLNREFSILSEISQTVNQSVDLDEILNNGLDKITELIGVRSAGIYLLDGKGENLLFTAQRNFSGPFLEGMRRLRLGEGITGKVALSGEPLFVEDYMNNPSALPLAIEEGLRSLSAIPLKSGSRIYGTLNIALKEPHPFPAFEKNLFVSIGQIIGGALDRAFLYTENVKRLEEQRTLYSVSQEIASRLELKVILQKIVESAVTLLGAEAGDIGLWDDQKQTYLIAIVHRLPEFMIGKESSPSSEGIVGEVIKKKAPVLYEDYEHHPNRFKELDPLHYKEVVGVPLVVREMVIGTMVIGTTDPSKHFQQSEIDLLFSFAQQAAIAIGNAKLYEDSLKKIKQLTILYETGKNLSSTLDLDELLKNTLELLRECFDYGLCSVLFPDEEKNELYVKAVAGREIEQVKDLRFRVGLDGIVGWVGRTGEPYYAPDASKDPRCITVVPGFRSEVAFPLKARDRVTGVLYIESHELRGFDEETLRVLSLFASQVSICIENAQLFADLRQTLQELKQAQDQIVQAEKLRALGEMASGVAHDFNNVLAVILGNIQLLLYQLKGLDREEIRERLEIIERSSRDGAETVRRIQEFTGVRRDKVFSSLSVNDVIKEATVITEPRWKDQPQRKGVHIELITRLGPTPLVLGNPSELREVLTNMVFNAVDAMPEGGTLLISTEHRGIWVEVRVCDTGTGMTDEVKRKVFDPFFTTKGVSSSGLGMSVSYGIIRRHGGKILVESGPGEGTTFVIQLPVGYGDKETEPAEVVRMEEPHPARILVIDDEDSVRDILGRMLKARGHEVAVASGGDEGIERFKKERFDLVFTDLGMPRLSGWDVGKALKKIDPKVPVAMITGWGMELKREKMKESGIDLVLCKPFNFAEVVRLVSEAMALKEKG
jgi:signal transduction histidine kinase/CheY-like chemotaxis protein